MENTTTTTSDAIVQDINSLKDDVAKLTSDVKAHGQARVDEAKQRVADALTAAKAKVAARPFAVLGVGIVLGFLFGRRSRRRRSE